MTQRVTLPCESASGGMAQSKYAALLAAGQRDPSASPTAYSVPLRVADDVRIGEDDGRAALLVDGIVQSISPEDGLATGGYWAAMVPDGPPQHGLILGLGGGTLARLLHTRWGAFPIVGVDDDPKVLDLAREVGWLPREALEIVVADAFQFAQACHVRFDYIAVDLFRGEQLASRAFGKPFLKRLRAMLQPRGRLAINMFTDIHMFTRVARIASFFEIHEQRAVGGNLVIHARRRR